MHTLIRCIDFDAGSIRADVPQLEPVDHREDLGSFVDFCRGVGLLDITFGFRKHQSMQTVLLLMALREQFKRLSINAVSVREPLSACGAGSNRVTGSFRRDQVTEHNIRLCDMKMAPERIAHAVLLIGTSMTLDDDAMSLLRLCTYELVVNTVEHASFETEHPEIKVKLITYPDRVEVTYRDNAMAFSTLGNQSIDIASKMQAGDKRGLGLFMLHKISQSLQYNRKRHWNETTFTIKRSEATSENYAGRKQMTTLSMEVTPARNHDAVIVKTKGSINSNTAPALDAELDDIMSRKIYTIVIDLSETDFISSSGIGVLLGTVNNLRDRGGDLVLMNLPKIVADIFDILNIRSYFKVINDLNELPVGSR